MKQLLLLRKEKENDEYRSLLAKKYSIVFIESLKFEYVNAPLLLSQLKSTKNIIATSQQSLKAIELLNIKSELATKTILVVGEQSKKTAEGIGFVHVKGSSSNTAKILFETLDPEERYLYLIGSRNVGIDLPNVTSLQVYVTLNLELEFDSTGCFVVLFSPSGLDSFKPKEGCIFVTIGPTTQKALNDRGLTGIQADSPSPRGVLDAIERYQSQIDTQSIKFIAFYRAVPITSSASILALRLYAILIIGPAPRKPPKSVTTNH
jgi:uroporphyrinogen-III synthase